MGSAFAIALEDEMLLLGNRLWSVHNNHRPAWPSETPPPRSKGKNRCMLWKKGSCRNGRLRHLRKGA